MQTLSEGIKGDSERGKKLVSDRRRGGSCFACHIFPEAQLPGDVGPDLSAIGGSNRSEEFLFNYIYDPRHLKPDSVMPPWGAHELFSPQEIVDIVVYLKTLTKRGSFSSQEDDPAKRPVPTQSVDSLDEFENPGMSILEDGERLYSLSCGSCHEEPEVFKAWATSMPKYEPRMDKMLGGAEFITRHTRATNGAEYPMESGENTALTVYMYFLANGEPINVDTTDPNTGRALRRGQQLVQKKIGQLNFACADCHQLNAGRWIRGTHVPSFETMIDHHPTYRTSFGQIWSIRKRMQWCNVSIRADELPPDAPEYGDIELYLATRAMNRTLSVPGYRN
jgi:sulfur-oxidizing protein SoxA